MPDNAPAPLPDVLAGPLLRRLEPGRLVLWLVASRELSLQLWLQPEGQAQQTHALDEHCQQLPLGRHAVLHLIDLPLEQALPQDQRIAYDLQIIDSAGAKGMRDWAPHLLYDGVEHADFVLRARVDHLLHGSCRKPHHAATDGLLCADRLLAEPHDARQRPALLLMSGDQVYVDDVAGPLLCAIHQLIARLGLFDEFLQGAVVEDSQALYANPVGYYQRADLLPAVKSNQTLRDKFFGGVEKPVFTSSSADNHLVTFAEMIAMYLLVWSPVPWTLISEQPPPLSAEQQQRYARERERIDAFRQSLGQAARVFAHLPTLMIFDDHDVTDDWNLSARWEQTAYGHPFSKRIIGNALLAYLLCQGWGNNPDVFDEPLQAFADLLQQRQNEHLRAAAQDALIDQLLHFEQWHYVLPTTPALLVLDTRTRRWRSEGHLSKPSGLMDWEALCDFQQALLDHPSCIIVSPAPMFGVKLIEGIQKLFTYAGHPLMVDAENWMAHRGAASVMLNIFRHSRTPGDFVILSGDVHYSFVYRVSIRHKRASPTIWQITSSGIKNEFPAKLLDWFDRLNRWLYAPWSPLNWLTKRRRMRVTPLIPDRSRSGERLWNGAGLGQVFFDEQGRPKRILQLNADGSKPVRFISEREERPAHATTPRSRNAAP
ncbi:alkaline phosphatase family protein [Ectopseudomonas oleovorans]|uniref:Alkaline phosphatase family protein n=1 Tax=Ectopseudomonas oleovorans TaxID=301 RepID=A0AA42Q7Y7_ECTOL|nr:alkaline phosphatase family protein [Pseudomonas oleovorans]MDH1338923.1 alkaline phosphatase family protein [Pseudomonas oleovorans]MDH1492323.1 alkaline phosphatase family protein [Pseudomonas oleovorans]WGG20828.1 alkaline phosphatase family protein [Pseudomonas oleovorans]